MSVERPPIPTEKRKPAWRLACLAYRAKRRAGASDQEAHEAAVAAVQSVLPLPWKEASAEAVNAVAYATKYHSEWFWKGAQHVGSDATRRLTTQDKAQPFGPNRAAPQSPVAPRSRRLHAKCWAHATTMFCRARRGKAR
jgi:hypothetical protein